MRKAYSVVLLIFFVLEFLLSVFVFKNDVIKEPLSLPIIFWLEMITLYPLKGVILGVINSVYTDSLHIKSIRILISYILVFLSCLLQVTIITGSKECLNTYVSIGFILSSIFLAFQIGTTVLFEIVRYIIKQHRKVNQDEKIRGTEL